MIVDLFAGPGGWDQALRDLDCRSDVVGIEWDAAACETRAAAGHTTIRADVAAYPTAPFVSADGLIASPPCQAFSRAGTGKGRAAIPALYAHVASCVDGWTDPPAALCTDDVRADLTLQPLRWADALRPRWVALEQVPDVLPLWEALANVLRGWGYSAWVGRLLAADYGVPQTRTRAFLIARRDGEVAAPPEPTHAKNPEPTLFGPSLRPWVSMAEALGWATSPTDAVSTRRRVLIGRQLPVDEGRENGAWRFRGDGEPAAPYFDRNHGRLDPDEPLLVNNSLPNAARRRISEPAPTLFFGHRANDARWVYRRPATTVVGSFRPDSGSLRVTVAEAGVLQSFPPDYPWQGSKGKQYEQVGNAVPPRLAAAVLRTLI